MTSPSARETAWAFPFGVQVPDDQAWHAALAKQFAPLVHLADLDGNGPADASDFIANSELKWSHDSNCDDYEINDRVHE